MSKYNKSAEAISSNLHLWGSLPTQTSIREVKKIDFYPVNSVDSSNTIDFVIPKLPKLMLSKVEVLAKIRVLNANGDNPAANNNVSVVSDLSGALWRNVDVSVGGVSITQSFDNSYTIKHFWDSVLHNKIAVEHLMFQKEGILLDYVHNKEQSENIIYYPVADGNNNIPAVVNKNGKLRADRIGGGKTVTVLSDLNVSLFKQEKLLPTDLSINISLTKNYPEFILLSAVDKTEIVKFDKVILQCTFHRPTDVMLNVLEERLSKDVATYHADKTILTFQNISQGAQDLTFDNLFSGELPYFFLVGVQDRSAYSKNRNKNPFTYHRFDKVSLYVDGVDIFPKPLEFEGDEHGIMYHNFLESIGYINGGDTLINAYYKPHQVMGFDLTQDNTQNQTHLNLQRNGSVRLKLTLPEPAEQNIVLMVLAYYERILEINKDREVKII